MTPEKFDETWLDPAKCAGLVYNRLPKLTPEQKAQFDKLIKLNNDISIYCIVGKFEEMGKAVFDQFNLIEDMKEQMGYYDAN